ncbi:MAG: PLP-dependent aminotransferase family protein [Rhizobiaceae bacterium]|nr:PLP-dependent aminotransferase family protein [Rhizobiaceae bacterium]
MRDFLIALDRNANKSLQAQLREVLVSAILAGHLRPGDKLPSTRHLSQQLGISRNTSVLVYQGLTDDGYLRTSERSGYFVNETVLEMGMYNSSQPIAAVIEPESSNPVSWDGKILKKPAEQRNIQKPRDWLSLPFPFIYGQPDPTLFPITDWRDCVYKAMGKKWLDEWSQDILDNDDPMLVDQIRTRILPRRGILVGEDQILVTLGAQQALYTLASLLVGPQTRIVMEDPGYPDARNIFALRTDKIIPVRVDRQGLPVDERLDDADIVYTTPSHQLPTTVTMTDARRRALLEKASENDLIILEDDYELESNYVGKPLPALKSLDQEGRVIYMGSFSKTLFPGLRLGFVVASKELIEEMRALRRLMVRHPPTNNQRSTAFFLSLGYYDVFVRRLHRVYRERWNAMGAALTEHFSEAELVQGMGGSSYWVQLPDESRIDTTALAKVALDNGILIEPGSVYFKEGNNRKCFRLGFSSIDHAKIEPGIEKLAALARKRGG